MNIMLKTKSAVALLIAAVTLIVFLPALQNEFVNWDDDKNIYENTFIRSVDAKLFTTAFLDYPVDYWRPLTWISHAVDYSIWGLNPLGHHLTNIILHVLNTSIVVLLVIRLMEVIKKTSTNHRLSDRMILTTAGVTGLLFGIHPLHVESVAWASERKDLLCALFFLLSIMIYTKYVDRINIETVQKSSVTRYMNKRYFLTVGFFVLALLSKPMAVTIPVVLLLFDWYPFNRIQSLKTFRAACVEKLPFIALSLLALILAILAQKAVGAMRTVEFAPVTTRILVAGKSLIAYLWKMAVPLNLIPFYPHPRNASFLSLEYLAAIVLVIGITTTCIVIAKKQKLWLSVWGYYVVTLVPVLGIIQVGGQSMADRYTYLPSIGPFLIFGLFIAWCSRKVTRPARGRLPRRRCRTCLYPRRPASPSRSMIMSPPITSPPSWRP